MIAQRIKPGEIVISKAEMQDNFESYTMLNIDEQDALALLFASENIIKNGDEFVITCSDSDAVTQMYKAIANKHKQTNKNFIDVSVKYEMSDEQVPGTSLLLRDAKKHTIRVCKRSTTNDRTCNINRLFINNIVRDKFFKEVQKCLRYDETKKYEMDSRDAEMYAQWSMFMNNSYFANVAELRAKK